MKQFNRYLFLLILGLNSLMLLSHPGIGLVMDKNGNIYYTDLEHVWKITEDGNRSIAVENVHTHELYIDAEGNLYGEHEWYEGEATDKWGNYVWRLSKDGKLSKVIPDVEGFLDNNTLVRDGNNNSYWAKKVSGIEYLMRDDINGKSQQMSNHAFKDIRWMHFSKQDQFLYIIDHLQLKRISQEGRLEILSKNLKIDDPVFSGVNDRHYAFGIWVNKDKEAYVALYGAKKIVKIKKENGLEVVYKSPLGWSPCAYLIAEDNTQWIMEFSKFNKTRVVRIASDGTTTKYGG